MAQPMTVPTGQPYGKAKEMADALRQAPLPSAPGVPAAAPSAGGGSTNWEAPVTPLGAPSQRPGEHVLDGVDVGPGRTAAQAGVPGAYENSTQDGILNTLRGIYEAYPLDGIKELIAGFSQNAPWSVADLFLPSPGDMLDEAKKWANKVPHPDSMRPGLLPGGGQAPAPLAPGPGGGAMFDPGAQLDTSQVQDRRAQGNALRAALGGAAAAGVNPLPEGGAEDTTDPPPPASDIIRSRRGAQ